MLIEEVGDKCAHRGSRRYSVLIEEGRRYSVLIEEVGDTVCS